jgi:hypothetical protein
VGIFAMPHLDYTQLWKLHCMAFGIPCIDDDVYKCEPIPNKLPRFTNSSREAPDWVYPYRTFPQNCRFFPQNLADFSANTPMFARIF